MGERVHVLIAAHRGVNQSVFPSSIVGMRSLMNERRLKTDNRLLSPNGQPPRDLTAHPKADPPSRITTSQSNGSIRRCETISRHKFELVGSRGGILVCTTTQQRLFCRTININDVFVFSVNRARNLSVETRPDILALGGRFGNAKRNNKKSPFRQI